MNIDRAYRMGDTHEECQDYALAYQNIAVVSDGCSGSPKSDFGARILAITAINLLKDEVEYNDFSQERCILSARPAAKILNLPQQCLDATLLFAAVHSNGCIMAHAYGDGVIAVKLVDGRIYYANIEFQSSIPGSSFPYYMNYRFDSARYSDWHETGSIIKTTVELILPDRTHHILVDNLDLGFGFPPEDVVEVNEHTAYFAGVGKFRQGMEVCTLQIEDPSKVVCIAILSDGARTFYHSDEKTHQLIPLHEILPDIMGFKGYCGQFVQRRVNRFLADCKSKGIGHSDDFSIAAIHLGEEK